MDGEGASPDNVLVERFHIRANDMVSEARTNTAECIACYNDKRPHMGLGDRTPKRAYDESVSKRPPKRLEWLRRIKRLGVLHVVHNVRETCTIERAVASLR
jgi:hypothetical protein